MEPKEDHYGSLKILAGLLLGVFMKKSHSGAHRLDIIIYYIIFQAFALLGRIPRSMAFRFAQWIGRLWFVVDMRHRKVAIENLSMIYGDTMSSSEIRHLACRVFCSLSNIVFEIGWSLYLNDARLRKYFRFQGMHHLHVARKKRKGVLILTAHIGNWELLMKAAGMIGFSVSAVYRPFDFKPLDMFFSHLRSSSGTKLFPKKKAMRKIMRSLKNNELVGILLDQHAGRAASVPVNFLGIEAGTSKGLALLAKSTGAPVVPAFLIREDGFFNVRFGQELSFIETGDNDFDIRENTRLYNQMIEAIILKYPEQWFWVHRRWKTRSHRRRPEKRVEPAKVMAS